MAEKILARGYPEEIPEEVVVSIPQGLPEPVRRRIYRKLQMAVEPNTRVVFQENIETQVALDIVQQMERALRNLLRRVSRESEKVVPLITGWYRALEELNKVAEKTCEEADLPYKVPRSLRNSEPLVPEKTDPEKRAEDVEEIANQVLEEKAA